MRALLTTTALGLVMSFSYPAAAQMCGGGGAGGMCGGMSQTQAQAPQSTGQAPAATPEKPAPQMSGGCACCKNMAMMKPPAGPMEMPKQ